MSAFSIPPLLYVAGPYSANETHTEQEHVDRAEEVSIQLIRAGFHVITPHKNTSGYEKYEDENINFETWIEMDFNILKRCDAVFLMNNWFRSEGARLEMSFAFANDIYVFMENLYPANEFDVETYHNVIKIADSYKN